MSTISSPIWNKRLRGFDFGGANNTHLHSRLHGDDESDGGMKVSLPLILIAATACVSGNDDLTSTRLGVGSWAEMESIRPAASSCGIAWSRVDPLDDNHAVFVAYNADASGVVCARDWVRTNMPEVEPTPERWRALGFVPPNDDL